jgi:uncharacterized protein
VAKQSDKPTHLRFEGLSEAVQHAALCDIVRASDVLMRTLQIARNWGLPDWWLVSGAIYNQVWNHLTDREQMYGVKDIDLFYFDPDTSWDAEDRIIRRAENLFSGPPPVEVRNQARVHLWYQDHFGFPYPPLTQSHEAIDRFACRTHCVGIRLKDDLQVYAPYGLDDIFSFRVTPNPILNNRNTHEAKAARQVLLWPELTVVPWPVD